MREKGDRSYLSGSALIVYERDKYYGTFSGIKHARRIAEKRNREITPRNWQKCQLKSSQRRK